MNPIGLYLHIPFCVRKCPYCDFYSLHAEERIMDTYVGILRKNLLAWGAKLNRPADTVYFGGGTPSLLGAPRLSALIKTAKTVFSVYGSAEITVECNPEQCGEAFLAGLREAGVNRISIGMQSALKAERKILGRPDSSVEKAVSAAKAAGFENISLDLMLGIPLQSLESVRESVDFCRESGVCHVSAYLLKIEKGTAFCESQGTLRLPDEEEVCGLYHEACGALEKAGFRQYEISNFAKPGWESRHNLKYWNAEEYLGLGPSAHSFIDGNRFYYPRNLHAYSVGSGVVPDGSGGSFSEYAMLRLRLNDGLSEEAVRSRFGHGIPSCVRRAAEKLNPAGLLIADSSGIRLTREGFLLSNAVIGELLRDLP